MTTKYSSLKNSVIFAATAFLIASALSLDAFAIGVFLGGPGGASMPRRDLFNVVVQYAGGAKIYEYVDVSILDFSQTVDSPNSAKIFRMFVGETFRLDIELHAEQSTVSSALHALALERAFTIVVNANRSPGWAISIDQIDFVRADGIKLPMREVLAAFEGARWMPGALPDREHVPAQRLLGLPTCRDLFVPKLRTGLQTRPGA